MPEFINPGPQPADHRRPLAKDEQAQHDLIKNAAQDTSIGTGSGLDPNVSGNIYEELQRAATDRTNANRAIEFTPGDEAIDSMIQSGADASEVRDHMMSEIAGNGVAQDDLGRFVLKFNGEQVHIDSEAPADIVDRNHPGLN